MGKRPDGRTLKFISYLQIIGIILVVLGHSFHEYPDGAIGQTLWFYQLMHNVRMPLFVFVSGFLMYFTSFAVGCHHRTVSEFTINKIKRLLIPYIVLSLVTFVPRSMMSGLADDEIELSVNSLLQSLIYPDRLVIPYFWFVQMSFILLVGTYIILKLASTKAKVRDWVIWSLLGLFAIMPLTSINFGTLFSFNEVIRLGFYFMLGILYCRYFAIDNYLHTSSIITAIITALAWVCLFFAFEGTDLARLASIFGILLFISLAHLLEKYDINFLDHLVGANYIIFLLSWYVNVVTQQILAQFVDIPWWIHTALSFIGGIYVPWLVYKYLKSHSSNSRFCRYIAFLLGQRLR